ncbi:Anti-sigma regulatory factor (Ser/Thr protein kinase) [Modestobacter sp. DSM 44400]|uniref:sensor histidine kinase n=1 Tax=Modestobacter sp. DSM 44400 TaxID=1550230 RepID=UPI00089770F4|nr:sensor histidine kinase [Modestobacter sp. DSM 44400]SDY70674.1 Anti-sigma regulatory factor (Ser/Thr protein kinase) [Modestobacter sp. DSM 44400]
MDGATGSGGHRALIADTDADLVTGVEAFVRAGLAAGQPVVVACTEETAALLRAALRDYPKTQWAEWSDVFGSGAAAAVTAVRRLAERHRTPGSPLVRVVLEPFAGPDPDTWREWQRYEAVLDHEVADELVLTLCVTDTRRVPQPLVGAARATHPVLVMEVGERSNPDHMEPEDFLESLPVPAEPLEDTEPLLQADAVRDLRGLRRELAERAADATVAPGSQPALEDFLLAVDEMTTNALRHGRPPVNLRLWASPERLVCTITDRGAGFEDPFIGYGPAHGDDLSLGGMGLWLARQLCDHVDITPDGTGVQVRLTTVLE